MMKKSIFLLFLAITVCSSQRCESQWKAIYGSCFRFFDLNETWQRAETYCMGNFNARLSSVPNINSLADLVNDARKYPTTFWVGGRWNGYIWMWGDRPVFGPGAIARPIVTKYSCLEIDSATRRSDGAECNKRQPFICVK